MTGGAAGPAPPARRSPWTSDNVDYGNSLRAQERAESPLPQRVEASDQSDSGRHQDYGNSPECPCGCGEPSCAGTGEPAAELAFYPADALGVASLVGRCPLCGGRFVVPTENPRVPNHARPGGAL